MYFHTEDHCLVFTRNGETLKIQPWAENSFRVTAVRWDSHDIPKNALTEKVNTGTGEISVTEDCARITNGGISAVINAYGVLSFYHKDQLILREYYRNYDGTLSEESRCLRSINRQWKGIPGGLYSITQSFESNDNEKIFGMGQYQQSHTDLKGCILDLEQRNSQVSIPFMVSSLNYGFLWNNPAVGRVTFGMNKTEWHSAASDHIDYWITVGDSPAEIVERYADVTGHAPDFPDDLLGMWQCKLRYRTQKEVLDVVHRYRKKNIPISVIVIDFFHWTYQGDWKFDPLYWPDPKAMIDELHSYGIKVMVSVWPSVDKRSENYIPLNEQGLLIRSERGAVQTYDYQGDCVEIDVFNPKAREYLWNKCRQNYSDLGIDGFWLDNIEPDLTAYDFDNYRYCIGSALTCSNLYPQYFSRAFFEPMKAMGKKDIVSLTRSGWAGSQKYGNLIWSGDVPSTFASLRDQMQCGLNMGLAGVPWWTSDIGGFMTPDCTTEEFKELLVRWFEFAVFTPVLRMHGDREPHDTPVLDHRDWGGGYLFTGRPNEIDSYGPEVKKILRRFLDIRLSLKDYLKDLYKEAHEKGSPLMRTMFYVFPDDEKCWDTYDQYMFGNKYLVAPILYAQSNKRNVYLPEGKWESMIDHSVYEGRQIIEVTAELDQIPVFARTGRK